MFTKTFCFNCYILFIFPCIRLSCANIYKFLVHLRENSRHVVTTRVSHFRSFSSFALKQKRFKTEVVSLCFVYFLCIFKIKLLLHFTLFSIQFFVLLLLLVILCLTFILFCFALNFSLIFASYLFHFTKGSFFFFFS